MLDLFLISKIKELKLIWFRCMDSTPTNNLFYNAQSTRLIRGKTNECTAVDRFYSMYEGSITYILYTTRLNLEDKCKLNPAQPGSSGQCIKDVK